MKRLISAATAAIFLMACGAPDPFDEVRAFRRDYKPEFDFSISDEQSELVFEIKVQNTSGGRNLQEVTFLAQAYDGDDQVIWSELIEFDTSGIGNYATESEQYKRAIENAAEIQAFNVTLAPDTEGEDWKSFTEFMRVKRN